ncbi:hypothetical protein PS627_01460 [Pseudomonas fluorescens]|nr:hypothetical protein PS627_01460 [Pseudomonas fluorescens]
MILISLPRLWVSLTMFLSPPILLLRCRIYPAPQPTRLRPAILAYGRGADIREAAQKAHPTQDRSRPSPFQQISSISWKHSGPGVRISCPSAHGGAAGDFVLYEPMAKPAAGAMRIKLQNKAAALEQRRHLAGLRKKEAPQSGAITIPSLVTVSVSREWKFLGFVRKEMSQTPHGTRQRDHGGIAFRELVEACHDPAVLFQPAKHALDDVALTVFGPIKQSG